MQAAFCIAPPPAIPLRPSSKNLSSQPTLCPPKLGVSTVKATPTALAYETTTTTVDYSSLTSVFPAEACETIGGEACLADIYPEVRLQPTEEARINEATTIASEAIEREYLDYNNPKSVFCAEACDDLGGEFCGREYQRGVY